MNTHAIVGEDVGVFERASCARGHCDCSSATVCGTLASVLRLSGRWHRRWRWGWGRRWSKARSCIARRRSTRCCLRLLLHRRPLRRRHGLSFAHPPPGLVHIPRIPLPMLLSHLGRPQPPGLLLLLREGFPHLGDGGTEVVLVLLGEKPIVVDVRAEEDKGVCGAANVRGIAAILGLASRGRRGRWRWGWGWSCRLVSRLGERRRIA
jgi:hypothetical protein